MCGFLTVFLRCIPASHLCGLPMAVPRLATHDSRWGSLWDQLCGLGSGAKTADGVFQCVSVGMNSNDIEWQPAMEYVYVMIKGSLVGETSVLRTFRMSGKELVKERGSQRNS